jgi:hypothetical protein
LPNTVTMYSVQYRKLEQCVIVYLSTIISMNSCQYGRKLSWRVLMQYLIDRQRNSMTSLFCTKTSKDFLKTGQNSLKIYTIGLLFVSLNLFRFSQFLRISPISTRLFSAYFSFDSGSLLPRISKRVPANGLSRLVMAS